MFHHFFRRFFPPVPPVKRITIRAFAGVAMLFHLPFFSFFIISSRYARGEMAPPPNFPPSPSFDLSYTRESESRVKIRERAITRVTLSMISGVVAPLVFHGIYSAILCLRD